MQSKQARYKQQAACREKEEERQERRPTHSIVVFGGIGGQSAFFTERGDDHKYEWPVYLSIYLSIYLTSNFVCI